LIVAYYNNSIGVLQYIMRCSDIGKPYGINKIGVIRVIRELGIPMKRGSQGSDFSESDLLKIYNKLDIIRRKKNGEIIEETKGEIMKEKEPEEMEDSTLEVDDLIDLDELEEELEEDGTNLEEAEAKHFEN